VAGLLGGAEHRYGDSDHAESADPDPRTAEAGQAQQERQEVMPLTKKGEKIKAAMTKEYGAEKGKQVFYASQNKGTIKGTHKGGKK
jgi:hypothetical protein